MGSILRLCGIVVGIATMLRLATMQWFVTYDPLFQNWLDRLSDIVELGFLTKFLGPFLHRGIEWSRSLGISVPDLHDEWRPAFVLSMLLFVAIAGHGRIRSLFLAAPFGALAIAVWSGLTGSLGPVAFALAFVLAGALAFAVASAFSGTLASVLAGAVVFVIALVGAFAVFIALVSTLASPFAVVLAVFVAFAGGVAVAATGLLIGGLGGWTGGWRGVFANASFNLGVDVFSVMLGALGVASLFANPSIW